VLVFRLLGQIAPGELRAMGLPVAAPVSAASGPIAVREA